jgi:arylsulfatase
VKLKGIALFAFVSGLFSVSGYAVEKIETTGIPGSPSATTTVSAKQLPAPDPKFGGVIKDEAQQSKA